MLNPKENYDEFEMKIQIQSKQIYSLRISSKNNATIILPIFSNSPVQLKCGYETIELTNNFDDNTVYIGNCSNYPYSTMLSNFIDQKYDYTEYSFKFYVAIPTTTYLQISVIICLVSSEEIKVCDLGLHSFRISHHIDYISPYSIKLKMPPNGKVFFMDIIIRNYNSKSGKFDGRTLIQRREICKLHLKISPDFVMCNDGYCIYFLSQDSSEMNQTQKSTSERLNHTFSKIIASIYYMTS
ncbi:hypothetical protein MXB_2097 [Myxobolus squamalis]|nr:hypothetical protein MXB_2097 [Myxobolus squamalis]